MPARGMEKNENNHNSGFSLTSSAVIETAADSLLPISGHFERPWTGLWRRVDKLNL